MTSSLEASQGVSILHGLRVIEIGQVIAGPFAGAIFAGLGADVIKVERPGGGDDARQMGAAFRNGDAMNFHSFNRDKDSVTIDLSDAADRQRLHHLLVDADVLIHNLRPGAPERYGIDAVTLCARYPRLICCSVSAFGTSGPLRMNPGYEPLIQAFSGLSSMNGGPGDPPTRLGISACDLGTGMWAVIGALTLLERRRRTGRGGYVDCSLLETALTWAGQKVDCWVNQGVIPERHASGHPDLAPYGQFESADGPILICCGNDRLFAKLAESLGHRQWIADPRFATNRDRLRHREELETAIADELRGRSRRVLLVDLQACGVPCAPINTLAEAVEHEQVAALGIIQEVPGLDGSLVGIPISFDGQRPTIRRPAPRLGEHDARHGAASPHPSTGSADEVR